MRNLLTILLIIQFSILNNQSKAQSNAWTQKTDFGGTARENAVSFSIDNKGYIGTGDDGGVKKDFWEYDPIGNTWTQKADFGGTARENAVGFSIGSKGYIGTGWDDVGITQDFWEYNPTSNTWTQKANFGGTARYIAVGFSIGSKGYIGTGSGFATLKQDFWEYDTTSNTWTQKASFGGTARYRAVGFSIGNKGYIGTGDDGGYNKDFWEYNPTSNTWTQMADFGGTARNTAVGFSIGSKGYIGMGDEGAYYKQDFWEYDPAGNIWTQKADFGGTARRNAVGFSIGNKGYIGTGDDCFFGCFLQDFWEYIPGVTVNAGSDTSIFCMSSVIIGGSPTALGIGPYSYVWSPAIGLSSPNIANPIASPITSTTYIVTVTDSSDGSIALDSVAINILSPLLQPICLITVDSTSTKNVIVWEKPIIAGIDSFRIYRDIIGVYTHIGSVAYNDLSEFTDATQGIDPNITSYRYKISVLDSCDNESTLSDYHKTIHLQLSPGIPAPSVNLDWDDYEGFSFTYYRISRDNNGNGNWQVIDSVGFGVNSYTDPSPFSNNTRYLIEAIHPDSCIATAKTKNFHSSKSNVTSVESTGINEVQNKFSKLKVYPNPFNTYTLIEFRNYKQGKHTLTIYNSLGQLVRQIDNISNGQIKIERDNLPNGLYFFQLRTDSEIIGNRKFIIE